MLGEVAVTTARGCALQGKKGRFVLGVKSLFLLNK